MSSAELTAAERAFAARMLPHFLSGLSAAEAAQAVLDDDARLLTAAIDKSGGFLGFNGKSHYSVDVKARGLASELSAEVYRRLTTTGTPK